MKSVILYSSAREFGNTAKASQQLATELNAELVYLDSFKVAPYSYEHRDKNDDFRGLLRYLMQFEHIVFASPVYWYSVTAPMKAFLDRITEFMDDEALKIELRALRGKHFSILSTSCSNTTPQCFIDVIQFTMQYLGMQLHTIKYGK
ncbi:flavodoxin family protein [Pseudoalteromonas fenneropenaei]|uniref:Flavodoxin family protein n=1 Tax=Pseudoalteromonas fenneropenaei TaxID=1737459 RepID=A0ABV7CPS1_9GAMM